MSFLYAFGWASIMLLVGVLLRAKIPFLRNMLVPASVIAGVVGFLFINVVSAAGIGIGTDTDMFTTIVNNLFTISFISITLTSSNKGEGNSAKNTVKGAWGMGLIWCLLYALTPLIGAGVIALIGGSMDTIYGMLVQFAFCQGPGQAATYGAIFEGYGWANATMVAIAFSAIGFVAAFGIGIPLAKFGISHGLAKHCGKIDETTLKGYYKPEEQVVTGNKETTCTSNIETLTFHFAIIGLCYVLACGIATLFSLIPGFLGTSFSGMMFINGMYAALIVKFVLKKLKLDYLLDNTLQSKITGWTTDYLVVCAFMAVSISVISAWIVQMLILCVVITAVTFVVCVYFGPRFGGYNDFERTLGMYGQCTGTTPTGIALIRIVDPNYHTSTAVELGGTNIVMLLCTPVVILLTAVASGSISVPVTCGGLAICVVVYLIVLKVSGAWKKPSFSWKDPEASTREQIA